jgi:predicted dehydrogenase
MKNILIIGGGSIGKRHLRNLLGLGKMNITLVEPKRERASGLEKEFAVKTITSVIEAYAEKKFEVAFVCSPSRFHIEQAIFCAEHGSDLFVEKPLSHNMDHVDELLAIVKKKELVTMVGSNWKYYPLFIKMKELLDSGAIGKVLSARCQFGQYLPDWHPWEDHRQGYSANKSLGGGILLDSHEFDYLTWFLGDVEKLACFAERVSDVTVDTEDVAEIILKFKSGAIGEIHLDYLQRFYQRNFEFFGEKGTIVWDTNRKQVEVKTKDKEEEVFPLEESYDINDMYVEQTKHFLLCVESRKQTMTPVEKGADVLKLICAAKKSSEKGIAVIV